jgi:phosphatidylglycerophosphate synthase
MSANQEPSRQQPDLKPPSTAFRVEDRSATAPFLTRAVSVHVLKILPAGYSANALTLTGGGFALLSALIVWQFPDDMRAGTALGITMMLLSALSLVIYGVFDQLDGMQARKLKTASPFGDFIDHWVDALIANFMAVPFMVMLEVSPWQIWLMAFVAALAFWSHNWETRNINRRELPVVGGLESIWTACAIMSLTAFFGFEIWTYQLAGVTPLNVFYWFALAALLWVVVKVLMRGRERLVDYLGFILVIAPVSAWLLICAPAYGPDNTFVYASYILLGMTGALLTGHLMRHHKLGHGYPRVDLLALLGGLAILAAGWWNIGGSSISLAEQWVVSLVLALTVARILHQGFDTYQTIFVRRQYVKECV